MALLDKTLVLIAAADAVRDAIVMAALEMDDRQRLVKLVNEYGRARADVVDIQEESDLNMIRDSGDGE